MGVSSFEHPPAYDNQGKDYVRVDLKKVDGVQHLDGVQAVMYARTRHTKSGSNDFERTERQRKLLETLLHDVMEDMNRKQEEEGKSVLDSLSNLILAVEPYVTTNMNMWTMFQLATGLLDNGIIQKAIDGEVLMEQHRIPMDNTWNYSNVTSSSGSRMSVVTFKSGGLNKNIQALHEFIYGEYIPAK